jgi:hypothetical protein
VFLTAKIVGLVLWPKQGETMVMSVVFTVFPCYLQRNQRQPFCLISRGNLRAGKAQQQAGSRPTEAAIKLEAQKIWTGRMNSNKRK